MKIQTSSDLSKTIKGQQILRDPSLNKGTAFTDSEREKLNLNGLLPPVVETLEQQTGRAYQQFSRQPSPIAKNLYLNQLQSTNMVLFYALINEHLEEMLPIVYTPTIAESVTGFSANYMRSQGLIISYSQRQHLDAILQQAAKSKVSIAVVTDGEGVLGIGDQGIGGLSIAIGKLAVYTLCGDLDPRTTLAIQLDMGTNNQQLLEDPLYLGWRHPRISGGDYLNFMDDFVGSFKRHFPDTLLHWEDLGRDNARTVLSRYRESHPTFNDDIQGTGAVSVSAVLKGISLTGIPASDHRICIFGAGTAGCGIADQLCIALAREIGGTAEEVRKQIFLIDRNGLLIEDQPELLDFQRPYARSRCETAGWQCQNAAAPGLIDVAVNARPTVLIGCSTRTGAFNSEVLQAMATNSPTPVIMPLSNPTAKAEATPAEIMQYTAGKAVIATGSPFEPISQAGRQIRISQCNNALIFPGIGIGMIISGARSLTDNMLYAASKALSDFSDSLGKSSELLPEIASAKIISVKVAMAVAKQAFADQVCPEISQAELHKTLKQYTWKPVYPDLTSA